MEQRSPDDHLVFSHTIDVLFRKVLAAHITPAVAEKLQSAGLDLSRKLDPAYPVRVFDDAMELVAVEGMAPLDKAQALHRIGQLQVEAFSQTLIGKATFQVLKLLSHRRFLNRLTKSFRQANNYVETKVEEADDGSFRVWINDVGRFPEVFQGILDAGLKAAGHTCEVRIGPREGLSGWYELRFT